jgi:hypothetical protein
MVNTMNFNIGNAVSFGLGAVNAQDQMQQLAYQKQQMEQQGQAAQMAMLMNRMKLQEEARNSGYAQGESGYARQLATDPDTMDLPIDQKMDLLAKNALSQGDPVRANEFAVNSTNFRNAQVEQGLRQQQAIGAQVATQQKLHDYMGSTLAAAADQGEGVFNQAKMAALQSGQGTPQDQAQLANLKWDPDLARRLRLGGMNSRQQAQTLMEQQRVNLDKMNKDNLERNREINQQIHQQRLKDQETQFIAKNKAGGAAKAPSKDEMDQASAMVSKMGLDPNTPEFSELQQSVVSTAKQIQKANPNIGTAQAMQMASEKIGKQDLRTIKVPGGLFSRESNKVEYKMAGATPQSPIPYTGDQSSLIPGRYYSTGSHGVVQFTGTGFIQVH